MKQETKLKTLNDMDIWKAWTPVLLPKDYDPTNQFMHTEEEKERERQEHKDMTRWIDINDLRESARAWIKYFDGFNIKKIMDNPKEAAYEFDKYYRAKDWIKHFFNLEDEK